MHDLAAPFRGHLFGCWRTFVGNHGLDFAAQTLLIKLECGLALAVEMKIGMHSHDVLLPFVLIL
jgi:hypothetical protein